MNLRHSGRLLPSRSGLGGTIALTCLLAGCATVGLPADNETAVTPQALLPGYRADGEARIRFVRVHRFGGMACDVRLYVNDQPIADVASGRSVIFGVHAGTLTVRAHYAERGLCPRHARTLRLQLSPGQQRELVYDISEQGEHVFQEI